MVMISGGRLISTSTGTGTVRTTSLAYDAAGNVASVADAENRTTAFGYDLMGRVTSQTLPDGRSIAYAYDNNGNLTSITPPGPLSIRNSIGVMFPSDS